MSWSERDLRVIWHPYSRAGHYSTPTTLTRAKGAYVYTEDGKSLLDAISSWWVNIHGHGHPAIANAVFEQMRQLDHVIFSGYTHPKAIELAERLLALLPGGQAKVFYSDNGSTAVEVALKMAVQYWKNQGLNKRKVIYLEGAYHGDTFGAMSVSSRSVFTKVFEDMLFETIVIPRPSNVNLDIVLGHLENVLHDSECAAFIFEPLVQGASGFHMYGADILSKMMGLCQQYGVLTIADEVMTGFARTGPLFACEFLTEKPDIVCLAKGITGGVLPLAVTTCSEEVYEAFLGDDELKTFFHGHSYTANAISCAAALASLDLLISQESLNVRGLITQRFEEKAISLKHEARLKNPRSSGNIFAVDFTVHKESVTLSATKSLYTNPTHKNVSAFFQDKGVLVRPLGDTLYFMPPYCLEGSEIDRLFEVLEEFLDAAY